MSERVTKSGKTIVETVPECLDSASAKLVYLYLGQVGEATVSTLSTALDMRKLSLYSVLDALASKNLVERDGETYAIAG